MAKLKFPIIDLSSEDRVSISSSIGRACSDHGFFYVVNHGIDDDTVNSVFHNTKKLFDLPLEEKLKMERGCNWNGYARLLSDKHDSSPGGDLKESYHLGPKKLQHNGDQWPSEGISPRWRENMASYYDKAMNLGEKLLSLIALALNLDEDFFEKIGAFRAPLTFLRMLHYPEHDSTLDGDVIGQYPHSDYGMITLLLNDGVRGLQICREADKKPQVWEDVRHVDGAIIVVVGDMLERWTNCLFRSVVHRVISVGLDRYTVGFFIQPSADCLIECLESCCSENYPPKFPAILCEDYMAGWSQSL